MYTLPPHLLQQLQSALQNAIDQDLVEPTAMTVATAGNDGRLAARTVLIKHIDAHGVVFYTNLNSNKGRQLRENPRIAACIWWRELQQQILLEGSVILVSDADADAYFASRPRISQLGAWASQQSHTLDSREQLEQSLQHFTEKFAGAEVPRPAHWSGFCIQPDMIEFWHGREFRLHDRSRWSLDADSGEWHSRLLYP